MPYVCLKKRREKGGLFEELLESRKQDEEHDVIMGINYNCADDILQHKYRNIMRVLESLDILN